MYFSGRVHSITYEDDTQAFYILQMVLDANTSSTGSLDSRVAVRGHVPGIPLKIGTWFGFEAEWKTHKKYGKQLNISRAPVLKNGWDEDTAARMLVSSGVGQRIVEAIQLHYPDDFLVVLENETRLQAVPAVDEFTALYIKQRWQRTRAYFQALAFIGDLGLPAGKVREVWSTFGDDAEKVLSTDPWRLVLIDGISFQQADEIAMRLGLDPDKPERVRGAVLYTARSQRSFGHLYLQTGQLFSSVRGLVQTVDKKTMAGALAACHKEGELVIDRRTLSGTTAVYEPWFWTLETEAASHLQDRCVCAAFKRGGLAKAPYIKRLASVGPATEKKAKKKRPNLAQVVEAAIEEWGESAHLQLSVAQKEGVKNALTEPVSILTGLPGTGKTTSLRAVVSILQDAGVNFLLCAPTGIAAKNLASLTGARAYTIHRAFSARGFSKDKREATYTGIVGASGGPDSSTGVGEEWEHGPENPHPAEVVVVDEASMIDQHLIYRLLTCTSPQCRVVLVGDAAQLPSVGPGNVLRDLVHAQRFPVVALADIFRQKETSGIVFAAHAIVRGEVPDIAGGSDADFALVRVGSEERVLEVLLRLAQRLYGKRKNFQLLSPRHEGVVGVTNLNTHLRELLNPKQSGTQEIRLGGDTVREDDRVMVVKNDYQLDVFNGDVGKVVRIDRKAKEIELKVFGAPPLYVRVPFKKAPKLIRLAYACTVHKAQGLEYDYIVMPIVPSFRHQLQRNLLYTAVTRAKKRVVLVGTEAALATAVGNDREDLRNSLFRSRLERALGGSSGTPIA